MSDIYDWDIAAANNNDAPPNGAPEFMEYEEVNNTIRELMAVLARWQTAATGGIETAGTQPAYTLTSGQTLGAYADGQMFAFRAHATSTGNVTLNVDGLGAVAVRDSRGNQLGSGDILANGVYFVSKIAASWRLVGHLSAASVQALATVTLASAPTTGNSGNAYTLTITNFPTAYANGQLIAFVANAANTGAATINVNSLGAESLVDPDGAALAANDIAVNQVHLAARVSGSWRVFAGLPINLATQVIGTLAIANGGTGSTSAGAARTALAVLGTAANLSDVADAATAFTNIKQAASDTATGVIEIATDAEMEAGSDNTRAVPPGRVQAHPSSAKFWAQVSSSGTPSLTSSYNVTSLTDNGTGNTTITIATDFSSANWCCLAACAVSASGAEVSVSSPPLAGSTVVRMSGSGGSALDASFTACGFGDQ